MTTRHPLPDDVPLSRYVHTVRRYLRLGVLLGAIGFLAGAVVVVVSPPTYSATASVLVNDVPIRLPDVTDSGPKLFTIDTEAQRVTSDAVLRSVRAATGQDDPKSHITLSAVPVTKVLRITYTAADPDTARTGARAAADAYLEARRQALIRRRAARIDALETGIGRLQADLSRVMHSKETTDTAATKNRRAVTAAVVDAYESQLRKALDEPVVPGAVIHFSEGGARRHNRSVPPVSGLVLGGLAAAAWARLRPRRLRSELDVTQLLPAHPIVARIRPGGDGRGKVNPLVRELMAARAEHWQHTVLVSAVDEDALAAAHRVAADIAAAMTAMDPQSVLVTVRTGTDHADERPGRIGTRTGTGTVGGTEEHGYLRMELSAVTERVDLVQTWLANRVGAVVFDGPPPTTGDGATLAAICDSTVLVATRSRDEQELRAAWAAVVRAGGTVEGIALVSGSSTSGRRPPVPAGR